MARGTRFRGVQIVSVERYQIGGVPDRLRRCAPQRVQACRGQKFCQAIDGITILNTSPPYHNHNPVCALKARMVDERAEEQKLPYQPSPNTNAKSQGPPGVLSCIPACVYPQPPLPPQSHITIQFLLPASPQRLLLPRTILFADPPPPAAAERQVCSHGWVLAR